MKNKENIINFSKPYITESDIQAVVETLRSGWIVTGPKVKKFEETFAAYKSVDDAVALNSCSSGLFLALKVLDIGPGDEVITTPITFVATVNAIILCGATPVLADIDPETWNINPTSIEEKITNKTKAILPVHLGGRMANMPIIMKIAREHRLYVVEDCAHALESKINDQPSGTFGNFGVFSFYANKNLTTAEGGMLIGKDNKLVERIRRLMNNGLIEISWEKHQNQAFKGFDVSEAGYKFNMTDIQGALGVNQFKRIDESWEKRKSLWEFYHEKLKELPLKLPKLPSGIEKHSYHLFSILTDKEKTGIDRNGIAHALISENIKPGYHYNSLSSINGYQSLFGWKDENYPYAHKYSSQTLSLPLSLHLQKSDIERVTSVIKRNIYNV